MSLDYKILLDLEVKSRQTGHRDYYKYKKYRGIIERSYPAFRYIEETYQRCGSACKDSEPTNTGDHRYHPGSNLHKRMILRGLYPMSDDKISMHYAVTNTTLTKPHIDIVLRDISLVDYAGDEFDNF
jgi:hypothetical protein